MCGRARASSDCEVRHRAVRLESSIISSNNSLHSCTGCGSAPGQMPGGAAPLRAGGWPPPCARTHGVDTRPRSPLSPPPPPLGGAANRHQMLPSRPCPPARPPRWQRSHHATLAPSPSPRMTRSTAPPLPPAPAGCRVAGARSLRIPDSR